MTLIAWENGPIFRDGAVGTGQECCCQSVCCYWHGTPATTVTVTVTPATGQARTFQVPFGGNFGSVTNADGSEAELSVLCTTGGGFLFIYAEWQETTTQPQPIPGAPPLVVIVTRTYNSRISLPYPSGIQIEGRVPCSQRQSLSGTYTGEQRNASGNLVATLTAVFP